MAGSVFHIYTNAVPDGTATSVVRPSDWNSNHLISGIPDGIVPIGNTAGATASISSGTLYIAGGNNVTLNQAGNSITISGPTVPQNSFGVSTSGNTLGNTGTQSGQVVLVGGNNITLSVITGPAGAQSIRISGPNAGGAQTGISGIADSANTQTVGTLSFANSGGVTFGISTDALTATLTASVRTDYQSSGAYLTTAMQSNAATISNINFSAGATSANLSALTFSNSGGVSFGLSAGTVTATVATNYQSQGAYLTTAARSQDTSNYAGINGAITGGSLTVNTSGVSINLPAYLTTAALSNESTRYVFSSAGVNLTGSIGVTLGSNSVSFSIPAFLTTADLSQNSSKYAQNWKLTGNSAGTQSSAIGTDLWLAGGNGVTVSGSSNSISFSVATNYQSQGAYLTTAMQSNAATISNILVSGGASSALVSAITFSNLNGVTFGYDKTNVTASVAAQTVQTQNCVDMSLSGNSTSAGAGFILLSSGTIILAGGNNITLSQNGQSVTISGANAGGVQTGISGIVVSNTTYTSGTVSFSNANGISFGSSAGQAITASYTVPTQTNQSGNVYASSNTFGTSSGTYDARTISIAGSGAISVAASNSGWVISAPVQTAQTQSNIQAIYDGANSISTGTIRFTNANGVSFSVNGQTLSASIAAQSVQTVGLYGLGNTTQNSSTTLDARTISFNGLGAITVGFSNGSVQISGPSAAAVTFSAGAASAGLGSVVFSNSNGVSFGLNGSTITGSVVAQTNQTVGLYAVGNTTQNSSTTLDARTLSFNAIGAMSMGYSNGSIQASVPATSSLVGTSGITVSSAGSTISIAGVPLSVFEPFPILTGTAYSSHAPASWWFNRVLVSNPLAISNINVVKSISLLASSNVLSSGTDVFSYSHGVTVYSRQNYGTGSTNLTTVTTASMGLTASVSANSASLTFGYSWVTNTTGGTANFTTTSQGLGFSSYLTGPILMSIPCVTTLQQGEYFFAHAHSSTAAEAGLFLTPLLSVSNLHVVPQVVGPLGVLGSSGTLNSVNPWGIGAGIASAITTNATMPGSVISGGTQNNWYMALSNA